MSRHRLPKEEAKELILSVAEKRFENSGLDGLKLADIASEAGITHSNILHHFGSRDGLHAVLMQRLTTRLAEEILENIRESTAKPEREDNLGTLFETLSKRGHANLLVWLLTSDPKGERAKGLIESLQPLLDQLQQLLLKRYGSIGVDPTPERVRFFMLLVITAAIGDGVAGGVLKEALRLSSPDEAFKDESYLGWMAKHILP